MHHLSDSLDEFYRTLFDDAFISANNQILSPFLAIGDNEKKCQIYKGYYQQIGIVLW